jgi:hypothetical protein
MDEYWGPEAEGESERVVPDRNKRPYDVKPPPPPQKQKLVPGGTDTGSAPGKLSSLSEGPNRLPADATKRDAVVDVFKVRAGFLAFQCQSSSTRLHFITQYAWSAYETDAMGDNEYHPLSHHGSILGSGGGIGYTVVDTLDTMLLMGLALDA